MEEEADGGCAGEIVGDSWGLGRGTWRRNLWSFLQCKNGAKALPSNSKKAWRRKRAAVVWMTCGPMYAKSKVRRRVSAQRSFT
jgi:hypothetical protein